MIFTLFYMYATFLQWWRLGNLKNKLSGTLNSHNALLVCSNANFLDRKRKRCLENLLVQKDDRLICTVVPKQVLDLSHWATFPRDSKYFPIQINKNKFVSASPKIYVYLQTCFDNYVPHQSEIIEIEKFGEPVAWKVDEYFELILKTDLDHLTKFVFSFCDHSIDINHELQLLKIESIDIVGNPQKIKYDRQFSLDSRLKYNLTPTHWKNFVQDVRALYGKTEKNRFPEHPRITIESSNKPEETKKVPVSEVKPIKKEHHHKRLLQSSKPNEEKLKKEKNKLDVSTSKRSKPGEHKHKDDKKEHKRKKHESQDQLTLKEGKSKPMEEKKHKKEAPKSQEIELENNAIKKIDLKEETATIIVDGKVETSSVDYQSPSVDKEPKKEVKLKSKISEERKLKREPSFEEKDIVVEVAINEPILPIANGNQQRLTSVKPPNVLVFADSTTTKKNVKDVLKSILNDRKYTLYDFPVNCTDHQVWTESTGLLVVCGSVPTNLMSQMLHFLLTGGQVLCMCSDLLYSVLHCFSTAEVREHELVQFSYGNWKQVQMMHHVFCYQASPTKKQFSKDSDHSSHSNGSRGSSPVAPRTPSSVEIQHNGKKYLLQIQVLGTEETWQTPSLLLASVTGTSGRAIFSQVHLEIDPTEYEEDESKYKALKASNKARLEILKHILSHHLDIDCSNGNSDVEYKPGYFLGRHNSKQKFLTECEAIKNNVMELEKIEIKFCGKDDEIGQCTASKLSIYVLACPSNFSTVEYFETLGTKEIGRLVFYVDILTSSQSLLNKKLVHGLAIIPRQQTAGVGRSANVWLSPIGCAMFSLQLHIPMETPLGSRLSLIQHLITVSVISAIKNSSGYEGLELGLKWPNDIYVHKKIKIGGMVASTNIFASEAIVNIGVGLNLDNSEPTTCLNDIIKKFNEENNKKLPLIKYEQYFAMVFNEIEKILDIVQGGNMDYFYELYYKYWLHSGSEVTLSTSENEKFKASIIGIDDYGFLKVKTETGKIINVQPDGNSFNMLTGLIAPKEF